MRTITDVILDRDGTIIVDKHYPSDPDQVELLPGAAEGLGRLARAGVRLFVASNQSGIGRGYITEAQQQAVQDRLDEVLAEAGVRITATAICPHAPQENCACRKPAPGLWKQLSREHGLDPAHTAMVGDKPADVSLGLNAGLTAAVLVLTGKGEASAAELGVEPFDEDVLELPERTRHQPHAVARDLDAACAWLLDLGADDDADDLADGGDGA